MKKIFIYLICVLAAAFSFTACSGRGHGKSETYEPYLYTDKFSAPEKDNYGYAVDYESDENGVKICISIRDGNAVKRSVPIEAKFADQLFLDMHNESFGAVLSEGSPAGGRMGKLLYITEDGWDTYETVDISSEIKIYPRHFVMLTDKIGYIGGDIRIGSTLHRTLDGGRTWEEADIGKNTRESFAPVECGGKYYELIEMKTDEPNRLYALFVSEDGVEWERVKFFSVEHEAAGAKIEEYYYEDGRLFFLCGDDRVYAMELPKQ